MDVEVTFVVDGAAVGGGEDAFFPILRCDAEVRSLGFDGIVAEDAQDFVVFIEKHGAAGEFSYEDEVATEVTRQQVAEKLKAAEPYLLQGAGVPEMAPITTGLGEFFQYTLVVDPAFKDQYSLADLRTYQDWLIKRQLLGIKGVVEVSSFGGNVKQYEVAVDPERLRAMNVSVNQVFKAIQINNSNSGGSYLEKGTDAYFIR